MTPLKREALLRARRLIENGSEKYLCLALAEVRMRYPPLGRAAGELRAYIMRSLDGYLSLEHWLSNRDRVFPSYQQARIYRLQWIDWMLGKDPE